MKKLIAIVFLMSITAAASAIPILHCPKMITCAHDKCNTGDPDFAYKGNSSASGVYKIAWVWNTYPFVMCTYQNNVLGHQQLLSISSAVPMMGRWEGAETGSSCNPHLTDCALTYRTHL